MFRNLSFLFLCLFFLIACDEGTKQEKEACGKKCEESTVIEESKKEQKDREKDKEKEEVSPQQQKSREEIVLGIYQSSFGELMEITFDEDSKTYSFLSTAPDFTLDLYGLIAGTVDVSEWDYMVESIAELSKSSVEFLGNGYGIMMVNPVNTEKYLLHIIDGVVVYDAFNE